MTTMTEIKRREEARRAAEKAAFGTKQQAMSTVPSPSQPVISPLDRLPIQPMQFPKVEEQLPEVKEVSTVELKTSAQGAPQAQGEARSLGEKAEELPAPPPPAEKAEEKPLETVIINGIKYGIDKPLPGMFEYYDTETGMKRAGTYVPVPINEIAQPSTELNDLVATLMKEGNLTNQEAVDAIQHIASGQDPNTGSAVLNKNPHLSEIIRDNLHGKAWEDTRNGVMVVVTDTGGTTEHPAATTTMLLSPEKVAELNKLSPEKQFEELKKLGVYPADYEWVKYTTPDGKTTEGFASGEQVKAFETQWRAEAQLRKAGAIDAEGRLDILIAWQNGITDPKIFKDAGFKVSPGDMEELQKFISNNISLSGHWYSKAEMEKLQMESSELYNILATKGFKAYEDALNKSNLIKIANWAKDNLLNEYPDPKYVAAENLIKGIPGVYDKYTDKYDVIRALQGATSRAESNAEKKRYVDAVELLFKEEDLKEIRYKWPGLFLYSNRKQTEAERKQQLEDIASGRRRPEETGIELTPDQEKKATEIMSSDLSGWGKIKALQAAGIPIEPGPYSIQSLMQTLPVALVNAAGYTKNTPMPQDDMVALIILGLIGTGTAIVNAVKNFRSDNDRAPSAANIIAIDGNKFSSIRPGEYDNGWIIDTVPFFKLPTLEEYIPPKVDTSLPSDIPPKVNLNELMKFMQTQVKIDLWWPTPAYQRKMEDFILASSSLGLAADKAQNTLPLTLGIPIDFNRILEEIHTAKIRKDMKLVNEAVEKDKSAAEAASAIGLTKYKGMDINEYLRKLERYETAHEEYMRKLRIWIDAWKSYVDSVHPEPVKGGSLGLAQRSMLAATLLKTAKGGIFPDTGLKEGGIVISGDQRQYVKTKALQDYQDELQRILSTSPKTSLKTAEQIALNFAVQQALQKFAVQQALQTQTQTKTATQTQTKTATQTQTKTQTQTLIRQAVQEAVEEAVDEFTRTAKTTGELTAETELTTKKTRKKKKDKDKSDEEKKRSEIKESLGAFNYIRGKLQDKPVNHTWYVDKKGLLKRAIVIGAPPEGAKNVTGKKSASLSLTKMRGNKLPEFRIVEDTGASDTIITSHNGKMTIDFTGDITGHPRISERVGAITERPRRISGKTPRISTHTGRISGKTPRLR